MTHRLHTRTHGLVASLTVMLAEQAENIAHAVAHQDIATATLVALTALLHRTAH